MGLRGLAALALAAGLCLVQGGALMARTGLLRVRAKTWRLRAPCGVLFPVV